MADQLFFEANQQEHMRLIDALLNRDADEAKKLIKQHLLSPSRALDETMSN